MVEHFLGKEEVVSSILINSSMKLSLIIATYNRAERLTPTLNSLVRQSAPSDLWEAIFVDNNSKDNTSQVIDSFAAQHPEFNIRVVRELRQGLSYARNCGIENAAAPLIAIIDDDEEIEPSYIQSYIDFFDAHPDAVVAGGAIIAKYECGTPPHWISRLSEIPIANPIDEAREPYTFSRGRIPGGGNMAIRRSAIERYGAFDPELGRVGDSLIGGEESNLFERLRRGGEQIWFVPRAAIWHNIPDSKLRLDYLRRLWFNIGRSQLLRGRIEGVAEGVILLREAMKWGATVALMLLYLLTLRPSKGGYLILMRWHISRGILDAKKR